MCASTSTKCAISCSTTAIARSATSTARTPTTGKALGAFGNATMFVDRLDSRWHQGVKGLRYKSVPLGETFYGENHQGIVDTMIRWFRRTAVQAAQAWGYDRLPGTIRTALDKDSQTPFNFLHVVRPREDYEAKRLDIKGLPYASPLLVRRGHEPDGQGRRLPGVPLCGLAATTRRPANATAAAPRNWCCPVSRRSTP